MLLLAPAFPDATLEEIALYGSLEEFLRNGNQNTVDASLRSAHTQVSKTWHAAMLSFGKELRYCRLAAQSFFLRKSIPSFPFHG